MSKLRSVLSLCWGVALLTACPGDDTSSDTDANDTGTADPSGGTPTVPNPTAPNPTGGMDTGDVDSTGTPTTADLSDTVGTTDGGSTDGGSTDGGSTDGGSTDGGSTDGGSTDGGSTDGGSTGGMPGKGFGDCVNNDEAVVCTADEICVTDNLVAPNVGVCTEFGCMDADDCTAAPPGGNAPVECGDIDGDGMPEECFIDCSMGQDCPTDMECFLDSVCVWPVDNGDGMPGDGFGDCVNNDEAVACTADESCVTDNPIAPNVGVCTEFGCMDADDCTAAPPGGNAPVECGDINGDGMPEECLIDCSMGQDCPTDMECFLDFICVWPADDGGGSNGGGLVSGGSLDNGTPG